MPSDNFDDAFERQHDAIHEFMRGNTQPFKNLYSRSRDATLANPFGGVARGWNEIPMRLDRAASYYEEGEVVAIETIASHHSSDLGYAIEIERLRARVGGRAVFDDVALRTTTVYRREDSGWRLVHRHADPAAELRGPEKILGH
jgi:ketosteroid isomerase-like protein